MGTASSGEAGRPPIRTLVMATLCNSAAVLPAGLTLIPAVQIRTDLWITVFQVGLAFTVYSAGIGLFSAVPLAATVFLAATRLPGPMRDLQTAPA